MDVSITECQLCPPYPRPRLGISPFNMIAREVSCRSSPLFSDSADLSSVENPLWALTQSKSLRSLGWMIPSRIDWQSRMGRGGVDCKAQLHVAVKRGTVRSSSSMLLLFALISPDFAHFSLLIHVRNLGRLDSNTK